MTDLPKNRLMTPALLNLIAGCDPDAPEPNRWAAFTDDELGIFHVILGERLDAADRDLLDEIAAELERRRP